MVAYGAKLLKLKQPKPVKLEEVESEMLQNLQRFKKSRKQKNENLFKYNLKFPSYVED